MLQKRVALSLVLLAGSIVVLSYTAVNSGLGSNGQKSKELSDGSPMPIPKPTGIGELAADGSPMPVPKPAVVIELRG